MDQEFWAEHAGRDLSNAVYLICIALVPAFMFCLYHKDLAFHCHCIWGLPWLWSYGIIAKRQTIQWPKDRQYNDKKTDNTMTKRQSIQWPKGKGQTKIYKTLNRKLYTIILHNIAEILLKLVLNINQSLYYSCFRQRICIQWTILLS